MKFNFLTKINPNKLLWFAAAAVGVLAVVFAVWWNKPLLIDNGANILDKNENDDGPASGLTGLACEDYAKRPIAVMLASDQEARPLSGLSQADMVFEMPVAPNGITRLMTVFQCRHPDEIGSVRSARDDFIPLAAGVGAILAHWGGEHEALAKLNNHIIDNIDAMKYEGTVFYRKKGVGPPHNGFTDWERLSKISDDLNYDRTNRFVGYSHEESEKPKNISGIVGTVNVGFLPPYDVRWDYDLSTNAYKRIRGGKPEIDRVTGKQIAAGAVAVMKTQSRFLSDQYLSVVTTGEGGAVIFQNGTSIAGRWSKDPVVLDDKLYFYGLDGKEIKFAPGPIWVEIVPE